MPSTREVRRARGPGAVLAAVLVAAPLLAACGGDDAPPPEAPEPTEALWNPCDALTARQVDRALGIERSRKQSGTETAPSCRFTPEGRGDPVLDANYLLFPAGLDAAWDTMGDFEGADVSEPRVRGADDARLVVNSDDDQLYVSGFVQNGDLIQTVDVVDPRPFDQDRVARGVRQVLALLSDHAREADVE